MRARHELAHLMLDEAFQMLAENVRGLRIDEALLVPPGGYRSALGTLKHIAGWSHVYRSYAFEPEPKHWAQVDWPRGLRETVEPSPATSTKLSLGRRPRIATGFGLWASSQTTKRLTV